MVLRARFDPELRARVVGRRPLTYAAGADAASDRPAHVRAASGVAWLGARLVVVQDDAAFLAVVDARGAVDHVALPAGPGGARQFDDARGNKAHKLDLEACVVVERRGAPCLVAFGSGSSPARERLVVFSEGGAELFDARALYAALRARDDFAGSELNVEGAAARGDALVLFNRGNGAPRDGRTPVDATVSTSLAELVAYLDGAGPPQLGAAMAYDLGAVAGGRLAFTDATAVEGTVFYLAVAEESPDATRDGPVAGVALGVLGDPPRQTVVVAEDGRPLLDKLEGLARDPARTDRLLAVVDRDDPDAAAELVTLELAGPWGGAVHSRE